MWTQGGFSIDLLDAFVHDFLTLSLSAWWWRWVKVEGAGAELARRLMISHPTHTHTHSLMIEIYCHRISFSSAAASKRFSSSSRVCSVSWKAKADGDLAVSCEGAMYSKEAGCVLLHQLFLCQSLPVHIDSTSFHPDSSLLLLFMPSLSIQKKEALFRSQNENDNNNIFKWLENELPTKRHTLSSVSWSEIEKRKERKKSISVRRRDFALLRSFFSFQAAQR